MESYAYTAYGLNFSCSFPIPEFTPKDCVSFDVTITYGKVPETLSNSSEAGIRWQFETDKFLLTVDKIARYLIVKGSEVIIEPHSEGSEENIRVFLLGSVLGAVLHWQNILVMHASVIQTKRGAAIFMGDCGAGKSTTLASFIKRGYSMLADDKAGIVINKDGEANVLPGFPRIRLTRDAVKITDFPVRDSNFNEELSKYVIPVQNFCRKTIPLSFAYFLTVHNKPLINVEPLSSFEKFEVLNTNIYRKRFLHSAELRKGNFEFLSEISKQIAVKKVIRPDAPDMLDELINKIEEDFEK